ncbi:hypothetical protein ENUP19_0361G0057 [Entamoeba nuttalli]|uniref:Uncharacterized protein n=1 Tax=Entamoeba nuttalli TaxID=412467 RepID=A0ABQ0DYF2_9EUKA
MEKFGMNFVTRSEVLTKKMFDFVLESQKSHSTTSFNETNFSEEGELTNTRSKYIAIEKDLNQSIIDVSSTSNDKLNE